MYALLSHFISHHVKKGKLCLHDGSTVTMDMDQETIPFNSRLWCFFSAFIMVCFIHVDVMRSLKHNVHLIEKSYIETERYNLQSSSATILKHVS